MGRQVRMRKIRRRPQFGGQSCPFLIEHRLCNPQCEPFFVCFIHCDPVCLLLFKAVLGTSQLYQDSKYALHANQECTLRLILSWIPGRTVAKAAVQAVQRDPIKAIMVKRRAFCVALDDITRTKGKLMKAAALIVMLGCLVLSLEILDHVLRALLDGTQS